MIHRASYYQIGLDLDRRFSPPNHQATDEMSFLNLLFDDPCPRHPFLDLFRDANQGLADAVQGNLSFVYRKVCEVNVDRETGEISDEKIDRGPPFQAKHLFFVYEGQDS